jgi:hypothetical protein
MTETKKQGKLVLNRKTIRKLIVRSGVHTGSIAPPGLSAPTRSAPATYTCNGTWTANSYGNDTISCKQ